MDHFIKWTPGLQEHRFLDTLSMLGGGLLTKLQNQLFETGQFSILEVSTIW